MTMLRYLEAGFRHWRLLLAPLVLTLLVSSVVTLSAPRAYQSSAALWFQSTAFSSTQTVNQNLSPAQVGLYLLQELLATRTFCLAVGRQGPLTASVARPASGGLTALISGGPDVLSGQFLDNAVVGDLQKYTTITASGPQLLVVTFQANDPTVAAGTIDALLSQFSNGIRTEIATQAQLYQQQLGPAQQEVQQADAAVAKYLQQHPALNQSFPPPDPTFTGLQQVSQQAQQRYTQLLSNYNQMVAQSQTAGMGAGTFQILDKPIVPWKPLSRMKTLLLGAGAGLAIGLLLSLLGLVLLVLTDRTFTDAAEVERALGLKVVGIVPLRSRGRSPHRNGRKRLRGPASTAVT